MGILEKGKIHSEIEIAILIEPIFDNLAKLSEISIIQGDLKPANLIFIKEFDKLFVSDFGCAQCFSSQDVL